MAGADLAIGCSTGGAADARSILRTGRSYEPVLAPTYMFTYGLPEMIQEATMGTALMLKGRLPLLPARIKRLDNFKRMIKHIIPLGDKE